MNIHKLKEYIINNSECIRDILEASGFKNITYNNNNGGEYRCSWKEGTNPTSVKVNESTLSSTCFSMKVQGDIIVLVGARMNTGLRETLKFIAKLINFSDDSKYEYVEPPFGGFYNEILRSSDNDFDELETYSEKELEKYMIMPSLKFIEDGISYETQLKYKIGYDFFTNRIIIPWRNLSGELVGIMGRLNKYEIESHESKYLPVIKFPKSKVLFGFSENYSTIQKQELVIVFESEKSVLRMDSMGIKNCVALGGSNLSQFQANNIKSLFPKRIIIALDEGLDEEDSISIAKQLKLNKFFTNEVIYLYDRDNEFLEKGSKKSPGDLSKEDFKKMIIKCARKV